jgi:hypothetical protein
VLDGALSGGESTGNVTAAIHANDYGRYAIIDAYTSSAELVTINGSGQVAPISGTLSAHSDGARVVIIGSLNIPLELYGAKGGADVTSALAAAVSDLSSLKATIILPNGFITLSSAIDLSGITNGIRILGGGYGRTIVYVTHATANIFNLSGSSDVEIGQFSMIPTVTRTGGTFFNLAGCYRAYLHDLNIRSSYDGIRLTDSNANGSGTYTQLATLERIRFTEYSTYQFQTPILIHSSTSTTMRDVSISPACDVNGSAMIIIDSNVDTLVMDNVGGGRNDYAHPPTLLIRDTVATSAFAPRWIRVSNSYYEASGDDTPASCVTINAGTDIKFTNVYCASALYGYGIAGGDAIGIHGGVITNMQRHGVSISGGTNISISDQDIRYVSLETDDTYDAINISGGSGISIHHNKIGAGSHRYAVIVGASADDYQIDSNVMTGTSNNRRRVVDSSQAEGSIVVAGANQYAPTTTITSGTTASVGGGVKSLAFTSGSSQTITELTDGVDGQVVTLRFNNSNTTIENANGGASYPFRLNGAADFVGSQYDTLTVQHAGTAWYEVARSVN